MAEAQHPVVHDLRHDMPVQHRGATTSRRARYAWIDDDPDLAPAPRAELPLDAWA